MKLTVLISTIFLIISTSVKAEYWVDEDGGALVFIDDEVLSFYSIDNFYYFDQIFTSVRKEKTPVRICAGLEKDGASGLPETCVSNLTAEYTMHHKGKVRALHIDLQDSSTLLDLIESIETSLQDGFVTKVSIDDSDLYAAYTLHRHYQLTPESHNILLIPD